MVSREKLLKVLSPYKKQDDVWAPEQDLTDIKRGIVRAHRLNKSEYDKIAKFFIRSDEYKTCQEIWNFLRDNMRNVVEDVEDQTLRSPSAMIVTGETMGIDCKNYALFAAGVLDAINRTGKMYIPICFRFAVYECNHVFVVAFPDSEEEIWIDGIADVPYFNYQLQPLRYTDKNIKSMALRYMSGMNDIKDKAAFCRGLIRERDEQVMQGNILPGSPDDKQYLYALCSMGAIKSEELVSMGVFGWDDAIALAPVVISMFSKADDSEHWGPNDWTWYWTKDPATHPANNGLVFWKNNQKFIVDTPWNNPGDVLPQLRDIIKTPVGMPLTTLEKQQIIQQRSNEAQLQAQAQALRSAWNQVYNADGSAKGSGGGSVVLPDGTIKKENSLVPWLLGGAVAAKLLHFF